MSFPLVERLKNLEQIVSDLSSHNYYHPPANDAVLHGVVRDVHVGDPSSAGCGAEVWINVCPFPPLRQPTQVEGYLMFDRASVSPMDGITDSTNSVKVFCLNAPLIHWKMLFLPGQVIKFWPYTGTAQEIGSNRGDFNNANTIKGRLVTLLEDWCFMAKITFAETKDENGLKIHRYTFKPKWFSPEQNGDDLFSRHWFNYEPCGRQPFSYFDCYNLADMDGATDDSRLQDGSIVKMYRYWNSDLQSGLNYEYWFMPTTAGPGASGKYPGTIRQVSAANSDTYDYLHATSLIPGAT